MGIKGNSKYRSEEVQDIIEKMPQRFGFWVTGIVLSILVLLFVFGWIIQYPDSQNGQIIINAKYSSVKLVSATSGRLTLIKNKTKETVVEDDYIAVIQNSANTSDILKIKAKIDNFNVANKNYLKTYTTFPQEVSLGDINGKYYTFLNIFHKMFNNEIGNAFHKQEQGFKDQIVQQLRMLENFKKLEKTREFNMILYKKLSDRDSVLLSKGGAIEAEFDQSSILYLNSKAGYQGVKNDINATEQRIEDFKNKLEMLYIQKEDEDNKLQLEFLSAYDDLKDGILAWEQRFVFKSPMSGTIDFLKFWKNNQFIQAGEEAFIVIPQNNKVIGQMHLPSAGSGKVKIGQKVIIKLDNYPFREFGSIIGKVTSISLATNTTKIADKNDVDVYLVEVELPKELTTNYGKKLDFKNEIKGSADIISNSRNLLERFFDNLRYSTNKT